MPGGAVEKGGRVVTDQVNVDNFVRAETDRMFASVAGLSGGTNRWFHNRVPTPLDQQTVIRMNRDTLYSGAVVDISQGATLTVPDGGNRYVSVMVVNEDQYINRIFHDAGKFDLTTDEFDSDFVLVAARVLVDPARGDDVAEVNGLQDQLQLEPASSRAFDPPDHDPASLDATRNALLDLARGLQGFAGAFGRKDQVNPVHHLIGAAAGWGGLPEHEAYYLNVDPGLPVARYQLRVADVPVDGFWSISLYNAEGFFPDTGNAVSINNVTATPDADGGITVRLGDWGDDAPNRLGLVDGWNYLVRLYRPRPEILDGTWTFPAVQPVDG